MEEVIRAARKSTVDVREFWAIHVNRRSPADLSWASVTNVVVDQPWQVQKGEISDWMYTMGDRIHGGFTIDPLLDSMPKERADEMRAKLVR